MKLFSAQRFFGQVLVLVVCLFGGLTVLAAPGDLDLSFNATAYAPGTNETVNVIKKQPDGKYLIGGKFVKVNGVAAGGLVRLNADFTIDTSFDAPEFATLSGNDQVFALGVQSDGKILVVTQIPLREPVVRRLLPNGTLDTAFQPLAIPLTKDIDVLPDNKFFVGGWRINADGTRDNSFPALVSGGYQIAFQADGKILAGTTDFRRYNADGSVDNSFPVVSTNGTIETIVPLPGGKAIIGGVFGFVNGFPVGHIALINADGTPDLTFNNNLAGFNATVKEIILTQDGKFLVAGDFATYNSVARTRLAQLNPDGSLDDSFQPPDLSSNGAANDIEILPNGKYLVGFSAGNPLIVFNTNGTADAPLHLIFGRVGVSRFLQQPDGKILIFGGFTFVNGIARNRAARLNLDGSLDTSFVPDLPDFGLGIASVVLQPDGKILVAGSNRLLRLNSDGSQDMTFAAPSFPSQAIIEQVAILPDGKLLVRGKFDTTTAVRKLRRYNSDGTPDLTFNAPTHNDSILTFSLQPDGKIIVAGAFTSINEMSRVRIARLNADFTVDTSFTVQAAANHLVWNSFVQPDGKIVLSGQFTGLNGSTNQMRVGRLNANGTLDTSFVQTQSIADSGSGLGMRVQPDGKIILWGWFDAVGSTPKTGIARFNTDGSLDTTFNPTVNKTPAPNAPVGDMYLQADGKILIGGAFTRVNGVSRPGLARLLNNLAPPRRLFDFDGDGRADISVFRPSENKWYILRSSDLQITQTIFAVAGDVSVPADYDGDGRTDVAVFRPSSGDWWYQSSINGAQVNVHWGQSGDIPRPSDFDGDGKTDFVLYRPSNNAWYRLGSTGATSILAFGTSGDVPLIGDFDGDGKTEPAVFRPGTGDWWYASSISGQFLAVHWGASGDIPVPGDYDADGKTDFVVFRPTDGGWYILYSTGSYTIATFGTVGDKPIAADYDGDGKADIAVFRPSTGTWYLLQTTAGFGALQFGVSTDVPTENAFLP